MTTARLLLALALTSLTAACIANPTPHPEDDATTPIGLTDTSNQGGVDTGAAKHDATETDPAADCQRAGGMYNDADGSCRFVGADAGAMPDGMVPSGDAVAEDAGPLPDGAAGDAVGGDAVSQDSAGEDSGQVDADWSDADWGDADWSEAVSPDAAPWDAEQGPDSAPPDVG